MFENLVPLAKGNKKQSPPLPASMMDMTFKEIEQAATGGGTVLLPISAIEEYGPHLPVAANTYLTNRICLKLREKLWEQKKNCVIGPPLFWGRNYSTGSFPGSFNLKSQTLVNLLLDILSDFTRWGFGTIILVNIHGDPHHNTAIIQAVKLARNEKSNVFFLVPQQSLPQYNLTEAENFAIVYNMPAFTSPSLYVDLHAGTFETSWMTAAFPDLVNTKLAKHLQSTKTTLDEAAVWSKGWDEVKRAFPLGYCGNPSRTEVKNAKEFESNIVEQMASAILLKGCLQ
ncbi:MAG: Creatinine amidohydrolase [Candidatus Dichloromethanomonas elyunquensis]|nr:MAG: Creatinine amidohydrolase [Candidatus Dichloromethanomonas elyunquensis]